MMPSLIAFLTRVYLSACGCRHIDDTLRDLSEEHRQRARERGFVRSLIWLTGQVVLVGLYELRDRLSQPRQIRPGLALVLGWRAVSRRPGMPIVAALTLGLGFGAAAAIFGTYVGFNRPLPIPEGQELRWLRVLDERGRSVSLDGEDLAIVRDMEGVFTELGAFVTNSVSIRTQRGYPVRVPAAELTAGLFQALGLAPVIGRVPGPADETAILLGHELWQESFDADPDIVGKVIRVDGVARPVVGVMPSGHEFPFNQRAWSLLEPDPEVAGLELVGRLHDDVRPGQIAGAIAGRLHARRAAADTSALTLRVEVPRFTEKRGEGGENLILATLLVLVVALVLVSCSNVSNLLLARALARVDLLAVHAAIGAGPGQVFVQLLAESLLISLAGAGVGLVLAAGAIDYIQSTLSGHWGYYWMRVQFEPSVVLFTLGLAVVAGTAAGMLPAARLIGSDLGLVLRAGSAAVGGRRGRLSRGLLNVQVAVSAVALIVAILMGGALLRSRPAPELRADDVFVLSVLLDGARYDATAARRDFRQSVAVGLGERAAVAELAWANVVPGLANSFERFEIDGVEREPGQRAPGVPVVIASDSYFELFGVETVAGRRLSAFSGSEELVAVVNSSFVNSFFEGRPPLEQSIRLERTGGDQWVRIVGVVRDLNAYQRTRPLSTARIYLPFDRVEPRSFHALYTGSDRATDAVRAEMHSVAPDVGVSGVFGLGHEIRVRDVVAYIGRIYQTGGVLAMLGGGATVLVALIGLYGALAFEVQRRMPEIGVRKALGADRVSLMRFVGRTGLGTVAPGLAVGFVLSAGFSPLLGVFLGRMNARDPLVYVGVFVAFVVVAAAATLVPGSRAARVDPVQVLRSE